MLKIQYFLILKLPSYNTRNEFSILENDFSILEFQCDFLILVKNNIENSINSTLTPHMNQYKIVRNSVAHIGPNKNNRLFGKK